MNDIDQKVEREGSVINRAKVKRKLLQYAADTRHHPFKRVSAETLDNIEVQVEKLIRSHVDNFPSKGVTL